MNHKKAMPANGTRFSATTTVPALLVDHSFISGETAGTEMHSRTNLVVSKTEKRIPAMAAACGVFSPSRVRAPGGLQVFHKTHLQAPAPAVLEVE
jgi:hypothetical protein